MTPQPAWRFPFAKVVIGMALGLLLGFGLCGLDFALGAHGIGKPAGEFSVGPLDGLSMLVMVLSAAGLVVSLIAWVLAAIVGSFMPNGDQQPQKLFDDDDPPTPTGKP